MKKLHFLFALLLTSLSYAQPGALLISAEDGEALQVYLNGAPINETPATQVFTGPIDPGVHKMRLLIHKGPNVTEVKSNAYVEPDIIYYMNVKMNKKGEYVTRLYNQVTWDGRNPLGEQATVNSTPPPTNPVQPADESFSTTTNVGGTGTTTSTTTTTTTNTTGNPDGVGFGMNVNIQDGETNENVNVGIGVGGVGMNMNVNVNGTGTTNSSTTTTTTSYSNTSTSGYNDPAVGQPTPGGPTYRQGCPAPMSDASFQAALASIQKQSFEDTKLSVAKQVLNSNCLFSEDIAKICGLFDFEQTKLDFAKYAYGRTLDPENYFRVNDVFEFDSSVSDLTQYIETHR